MKLALQLPSESVSSIRHPLKWAGGKRWLVPHLRGLWLPHRHRRMVEPFCGGLAITLGLLPSRALLNDINTHAMNFYKWLKRRLYIEIELINSKEMYYKHRVRFNQLIRSGRVSSREAASLFYYLNRTGYNGLCRFNRSGEFNVPFGQYKTISYERDFSGYNKAFSAWQFSSKDFQELKLQKQDFVYADPPYDVEFTQYSKGGFSWSDQARLAEWLASFAGPVVVSNQATQRVISLYQRLGFEIQILKAPRRISCTGDRMPADEMLATRNLRQ